MGAVVRFSNMAVIRLHAVIYLCVCVRQCVFIMEEFHRGFILWSFCDLFPALFSGACILFLPRIKSTNMIKAAQMLLFFLIWIWAFWQRCHKGLVLRCNDWWEGEKYSWEHSCSSSPDFDESTYFAKWLNFSTTLMPHSTRRTRVCCLGPCDVPELTGFKVKCVNCENCVAPNLYAGFHLKIFIRVSGKCTLSRYLHLAWNQSVFFLVYLWKVSSHSVMVLRRWAIPLFGFALGLESHSSE